MMIMVKIGGEALQKNLDNIVSSIVKLAKEHNIIIVHGGGNMVTFFSKKMGVQPRFVVSPSGIKSRFTSKEELEIYIMVMAGLINKKIVQKILAHNIKAFGLTGVDNRTVVAKRKKRLLITDENGRKRVISGGYTGKITGINPCILQNMLKDNVIPVVAPLAISDENEILNVDSDQMATEIAIALKADLLIYLTGAPGVVLDGKVLYRLTPEEASIISSKIGYGMNRKLILASKAVENGVRKAIITNGLVNNPIENALNNKGSVIE